MFQVSPVLVVLGGHGVRGPLPCPGFPGDVLLQMMNLGLGGLSCCYLCCTLNPIPERSVTHTTHLTATARVACQ